MRSTILASLTFFVGLSPAFAEDWRMMAEWHSAAQQAQSDFLRAGNQFGDIPSRQMTAMRLAMFTAANAVEKDYSQYLEGIEAPEGADAVIAAAAAAKYVLMTGFGVAAEKAVLSHYEKVTAGVDQKTITASERLGEAAAKAALALAQETVDDKYPHYRPQTTAGVYVTPYLPAFPPSFLDQKPWFLSSREAVRAPNPPSLESETWARDFNEVKRLGGKHNSARTEEQSREALFWVGQGYEILIDQAAERRNWPFLPTARLYAMLAMAVDDGTLAAAESKYHYNFWRPITAIRRAEIDGNDATQVDAGWEPFRTTPNHPEYPCAHCQRGGTVAEVLGAEIKLQDGESFRVYDERKPNDVVTISDFDEFEERMSNSRIYIGAHYRSSNEAGQELGRSVAKLAITQFATPMDTP